MAINSKVTIQDVAVRAKVSPATVSRVLNGNPTVDDELRQRVLRVAEELAYQPSRAARRLRKQSADVIGLIVSDIQNPHFVSIIKGAEEEAYNNDINILLCNSNEESQRLTKYLRVMQAESVAGLIVVPTGDDALDALKSLRTSGIPVVILDRRIKNFDADIVRSDNVAGAYEGVSHLLKNGYRRIAFLQPNVLTGYERYEGYLKAHQDYGVDIDTALVKIDGHQIDNSYHLTQQLMNSSNPPDALFTASNFVTLGTLRALRELGIRVPDDIGLVGFDDLPYAEEFKVSLTTIAQPIYELGQEAVRTLIWRLANPTAPYVRRDLATTLMVRESCGTNLIR